MAEPAGLVQLGSCGLWQEVLVQLESSGKRANIALYTAAIQALSQSQQRLRALETFARLRRRKRLQLDAFAFGAAMAAAESWERAQAYLCQMADLTLQASAISYNSALSGSRWIHRWASALQLLRLARCRACEVNEVTIHSLLGVEWRRAGALLDASAAQQLPAQVIGLNALINAMKYWQRSCGMLTAMRSSRLEPNIISANSAAANYESWEDMLSHVRTQAVRGIAPDLVTRYAMQQSLRSAGRWHEASGVLNAMSASALQTGSAAYNAALAACQSTAAWAQAVRLQAAAAAENLRCTALGTWEQSLQRLEEAKRCGLRTAPRLASKAASSCVQQGRWLQEMSWLACLRQRLLAVDVLSMGCAVAAQWRRALETLLVGARRGVEVDILALGGAVDACDKAGAWTAALGTLSTAKSAAQALDLTVLNSVLSALGTAKRWAQLCQLLDTASRCGPGLWDLVSYTAAVTACGLAAPLQAVALFEASVGRRLQPDLALQAAACAPLVAAQRAEDLARLLPRLDARAAQALRAAPGSTSGGREPG
ncbi:unnamed protein product [Effrenium voratum]|nr:unnamed protein product [Effrenium voratum]